MSFLGSLKNAFKSGSREISAEYAKNKDFLEAVCAGVALVGMADGSISDTEKLKAKEIVGKHVQLSKLYNRDVIEQTLSTMFDKAKDFSGRQSLARELDDIKNNGSQMCEDVYLIAYDIAMADGSLEDAEKKVLGLIAQRLNVDVTKFDFG